MQNLACFAIIPFLILISLKGYSRDDCDTSGCFFELSIQLIVVMCGKQWLNNIVELIIP